ncbi:MAG: amino acid ABC transporter substrate-binding protein [Candidatus Omnitrophica bacterium]|nr:amino acid ABC transporter substrate-binding protein [Candidatus Omnitrophota bacterium]
MILSILSRMQRRIPLVFVIVFLIIPGNAYAETAYAPDIARITAKGKIVVAMLDKDSPPFFMSDAQGHLSGIDVDLANDIAGNLGVSVEFNRKAKTFDGLVDMVAAREADVAISYLSKTLERAKKVLFTDTYVSLYQTIVVNRLAAAQRRWGDDPRGALNNKTVLIGTLKGSSYLEFAKKMFPLAAIVPYEDLDAAFDDAKSGKIQAAVFDDMYVKIWNHAHPDAALYVQTCVFKDKEDPIGIAVHGEDGHLREWLDQYLRGVIKDGTVDRWVNKYLESAR